MVDHFVVIRFTRAAILFDSIIFLKLFMMFRSLISIT